MLWKSNLLKACRKNDIVAVQKFLDENFNSPDEEERNANLLEHLVLSKKHQFKEEEIIEILPVLLSAGIDLNHQDAFNGTAFIYAIRKQYFNLAMAIAQSGRYKLHLMIPSHYWTINTLITEKNYDLLDKFLKLGLASDPASSNHYDRFLMEHLWKKYFSAGMPSTLLSLLKVYTPQGHASVQKFYPPAVSPDCQIQSDFRYKALSKNLKLKDADHYKILFGQSMPRPETHDKDSRLKILLSEFCTIIHNPHFAVTLLREFEDQLQENWELEFGKKPIQEVLHCETLMKEYAGFFWPVPSSRRSPSFSKNGFLEKQTIAFMRKRGFANNLFKMYHILTKEDFAKVICAGDFFTENTLTPTLLLHGKGTHNIGRIILILAWEKGLLNKIYQEGNVQRELTLQEVFSALVPPWPILFDAAVSSGFNNPYELHATLLSYCKESLPHFSALTTHSFCKGIFRIREFFNDISGENWSVDEVWDRYITKGRPYRSTGTAPLSKQISWLQGRHKIPLETSLSETSPIAPHRLSKGFSH